MPGYFRMRRDLTAPIDPLPLPKGIELVPFSKALSNESRELMMRVYPDGLNDGGISFEGFWTWLTNEPEYDPALMFVACQNGIVVGFCHCWRDDFVKDLVVAPEFRRRGLGSALLTLALETFARRGATSVDLKTDVDNDKAQSLYRRLGFAIIERVDD